MVLGSEQWARVEAALAPPLDSTGAEMSWDQDSQLWRSGGLGSGEVRHPGGPGGGLLTDVDTLLFGAGARTGS